MTAGSLVSLVTGGVNFTASGRNDLDTTDQQQ